ncbi:S41 family peptidase [Planctomycetota bacterium]|nr:S41 family peptidase [Planctomycetota bacterium]
MRYALPVVALALLCTTPALAQRAPTLSPFESVYFQDDTPYVQVDGTWYELRALDHLQASQIVDFCHDEFGGRWDKRFCEDLVEVLQAMDHRPRGWRVTLALTRLGDGQEVELDSVVMTEDNRQACWDYRNAGSPPPPGLAGGAAAVEAGPVDPAYAHLSQALIGLGGERLSRDAASADLGELESALRDHFSYRDLKGVDVAAACNAVRASVSNGINQNDFALQLMKLMAIFGDGHSAVDVSLGRLFPRSYAPFLVGVCGERFAAFRGDRSALLDAEHPYLVEIDGRPLAEWLEAAGRIEAQGSPAFVRTHASRNLRYLAWLRLELGVEPLPTVSVTLANAAGGTVQAELRLTSDKPIYGEWPDTESDTLAGRVGYLRIASMEGDRAFLRDLEREFKRFRRAKALVIDVRGNGGGTRDALRLLFPYLMARDEAPAVVNVAAARIRAGADPDAPEGYLENRSLWPAASREWGDTEREAVEAFAAGFTPSWQPAAGDFSGWHYFAVQSAGRRGFHFDAPVVVLMDGYCFSATDIFLGALETRGNVTLMGTASGGGSGRSRGYDLRNSGLEVRLSSMISFRPDGSLYDGVGIAPDVVVDRIPTDYLRRGTDTQLQAALEHLSR